MNNKYVLEEIKKASKNAIEAYISLQYYKSVKDKKYYDYCVCYITEINEILTNLKSKIEVLVDSKNNRSQGGKNEQLQ